MDIYLYCNVITVKSVSSGRNISFSAAQIYVGVMGNKDIVEVHHRSQKRSDEIIQLWLLLVIIIIMITTSMLYLLRS